jgi:serine/threonine protein kinase
MSYQQKCQKCGVELGGNVLGVVCPSCQAGSTLLISPDQTPALPEICLKAISEHLPDADDPSAIYPKQVKYFGDYELIEEIARGGMGVVYRARQISLNRAVALKMILSNNLATRTDIQRFRNEATAMANVDHPNLVRIFEVGEHETRHYYSMQLIEGSSLAGRLSDFAIPKIPPKGFNGRAYLRVSFLKVVRLVATLARAVHHAHERGIMHRDLKPANILIDHSGEPHITDFGLAKQLSGGVDLTLTGMVIGTPSYMAPEQTQGRAAKLTPATDTYGLGAILYLLLTGQPPFNSDNPIETMQQVISKDPVHPSTINPLVDKDLETICLKCLEKDPKRRYETAQALAEDLDRWERGEPVKARPTNLYMRMGKWVKRHPRVSIASLSAVLVAGVFAGVQFFHPPEDKLDAAMKQLNTILQQSGTDKDLAHSAKLLLLMQSLKLDGKDPMVMARLMKELSRGAISLQDLQTLSSNKTAHPVIPEKQNIELPDAQTLKKVSSSGETAGVSGSGTLVPTVISRPEGQVFAPNYLTP